MNTLIKILFVIVTLIGSSQISPAQTPRDSRQISREQLAEKQAKHIAETLSLSKESSEKFIPIYVECQKEIWAIAPRHERKKRVILSESQTDSLIQVKFEHSQKLLDIRKKYYAEYSKFLSPRQIEKVYEIELQMMKRLEKRRSSRMRRNQSL